MRHLSSFALGQLVVARAYYQVLALHFKKVTLCIMPILALGSDQMHKIAKGTRFKFGCFSYEWNEWSASHKIEETSRNSSSWQCRHPPCVSSILKQPWRTVPQIFISKRFNQNDCNGQTPSLPSLCQVIQGWLWSTETDHLQSHPPTHTLHLYDGDLL